MSMNEWNNELHNDLILIFKSYRKWNSSIEKALLKLGFEIEHKKDNHIKIIFYVKGIKKIVILASTASDKNAGLQTIRMIRRQFN